MSSAASLHAGTPVPTTRGVVLVHSVSAPLCPHVAWALDGVLGRPVALEWAVQPRDGGMRTELTWAGPQGLGAAIASALAPFADARFEVTEDASPGADGARWMHAPGLGMRHGAVNALGDLVVDENVVRTALAQHDPELVRSMLDDALGGAWDVDLEPYRHAVEHTPVRLLHRAG